MPTQCPIGCFQANAKPFQTLAYKADEVVFWQIGSFGTGDANETAVAALINADPLADLVVTSGNNDLVGNYTTSVNDDYGTPWVVRDKMLPCPGSSDWAVGSNLSAYLAYFASLENQRYYCARFGCLEFFMLDSSSLEPDGIAAGTLNSSLVPAGGSLQWRWFVRAITGSKATWKIVVFHDPPYSSSTGLSGGNPVLRWQFKQLGADVVIAGRARNYERLVIDGIPYLVNGAGGQSLQVFNTPLASSVVRYSANFGALRLVVRPERLTGEFRSLTAVQDQFEVTR